MRKPDENNMPRIDANTLIAVIAFGIVSGALAGLASLIACVIFGLPPLFALAATLGMTVIVVALLLARAYGLFQRTMS